MSRWTLYSRGRKAINDYLLGGALVPIASIIILLFFSIYKATGAAIAAGMVKAIMKPAAVVMIYPYFFAYYTYLDDIFLNKIVIYKGYVSSTWKSRAFGHGGRGNPETSKLSAIKRLVVSCEDYRGMKYSGNTFNCYYKKIWDLFEVGKYVEITYLMNSKVIVDVKELEEDLNNNFAPKKHERKAYLQGVEGKFFTTGRLGRIFRGLMFCSVCIFLYVIGVNLLCSTLGRFLFN